MTIKNPKHIVISGGNLNLIKSALFDKFLIVIKQLEIELKTDLFFRAGYRLSLTTQGEQLFDQALRLKRELDDTCSVCQQFHQTPAGTLKVIIFPYFADKFIFPTLKIFLQRYSRLHLIIDTSERIPDFEREQAQLRWEMNEIVWT